MQDIVNIIGIIVGVIGMGYGLWWYLFKQEVPKAEGCLCYRRTRMVLDMNYDCPLHGHWRSSMQKRGF